MAREKSADEKYREHFDEVFEKERFKRREKFGRWVWDPIQQKLVRPSEQVDRRALDAPILAGRFYENLQMPGGREVNSRSQYNNYLKETGTTHASDYGLDPTGKIKENSAWDRADKERADIQRTGGSKEDRRERRELIGRALYEAEQGRLKRRK